VTRRVNGDDAAVERPSIEVGLRRDESLDLDASLPESNPELVGRIVAEIEAAGPMTFARFMELALYDPDAGYYVAGATGPGRHGDFLTAPESHPIFGWAVGRHLESVWAALDRPARFVVREHGAGTGALAAGILGGLRRSGSALLEAIAYQAIEASPARLEGLVRRLEADGLARHLEPVDDVPTDGAILANELLDALPVHQVEGGPDGQLVERYVVSDEAEAAPDGGARLATALGTPSTLALAERLEREGVRLAPRQQAEICLFVDGWIAGAAAPLARGELLVIDYGHPAAELYAPNRGSTLRAYHRHRVHVDPFVAVGRQDLTAHVDLTAVERASRAAGLEPLGHVRQAEFLAALGIGELLVGLQSDGATDLAAYLEARSALVRMLDPRATGAFRVLAFGRGLPAGAEIRGLVPAP
jgi:SAM-dependent MidA family methyltransferase